MKKEIHMNQSLSIFEQAGKEIPTGLIDNKVSTVFTATGLNWEVVQKPVAAQTGTKWVGLHDGESVPTYEKIPSLVANYRSDNNQFVGMVRPRGYKIVQNTEAFDFIDELPNFTFE